jgi:hypothetical protein
VSDYLKLCNQSGVFTDPQTGFSLKFDQEKPLPEPIGKLTRDWLSGGGLVRFNREKTVARFLNEEPEGREVQIQPTKEPQPNTEEWDRRFEGLSVSDLRKLCKELGLSYSRKQDRAELINLIVEHEAKAT